MPLSSGSTCPRVRISHSTVWSSQPRKPTTPGLRTGGPTWRRRANGMWTTGVFRNPLLRVLNTGGEYAWAHPTITWNACGKATNVAAPLVTSSPSTL
jgi:hypothetical protein